MTRKAPGKKGRPQNNIPTVQVGLRLDEPTVEILDSIAYEEGRTRSKQVEIFLRKSIAEYKKKEN